MIKPAILYKESLNSCFAKSSLNPADMFYTEQYWQLECHLSNSTWETLQMVSVDQSDNIVGFFNLSIDQGCHFVSSLGALRFLKNKEYDIMFAKDFLEVFLKCFNHFKYNKICFSICMGSPHEKMYNKFIEKYGGKVVGVREKHYRTVDGTIHDMKIYEISRDKFLEKMDQKWKK